MPPSWEGERNDLCLAAALHYPDRFAVMGRLDIDDSRNRSRIAGWRSGRGMLGIRLLIREGARWLEQRASHWLWKEAEAAGVPLTLAIRQSYPLVEEIAERYPGLRLSIDHLGCPHDAKGDAAFAHLPQLLQLARLSNIAVKASCVPAYSSDPYPFTSLHEPLRQVFDAFGPRRMFWGSDLSRLPCPYREAVSLFTEELPWLRGDDLACVLGRAACEWFGWSRTPTVSCG